MIYLDAAATTFQKPRTVAAAVERAMHYMTTPGRGAYQEARLAAETAFRCRSEAAALFHAVSYTHLDVYKRQSPARAAAM